MYAEKSSQLTNDDQSHLYYNLSLKLFLNILLDAFLFMIFCGSLTICLRDLSEFFGYVHFNYSMDSDRAIISFVFLLVLAIFMPRRKTLHDFVVTLYVYSFFLPTLVWFFAGDGTILALLVTATALFAMFFFYHIKVKRLVIVALTSGQVALSISLISVALWVWIISINGFSMVNIHIYDVYKFRRDAAENFPTIVNYLWPQFSNALLPLALTIFYTTDSTFCLD